MKTTNVAAGAMLASAASAALPEGVVQFDVGRRSAHPKLTRRATANTDSSTIDNNLSQGGYFATCKIGTPQQTLTLQLDTGSSDIWVPSSINSADSSTFVVVGKDEFSISYVDGSHSDGSYFTDVFTIGGSTVTNMTMGLGQSTDINFGLVGIGYKTDEAIVSTTQSLSSAYNNLPLVMVQEGVIKTNAYSLWLNDLEASTGNLLFGGIDTDKYKGDLTKVNIYKDPNTNTFTSFIVALTSVNAVSTSGDDALTSTAFPVPVVLDSGTTLSYVPQDMAEEIWKEVGAEYDAQVQLAVIPCSMASSGGHFTFGFGGTNGATIDVGMDELVLDIATSSGPGGPSFSSGRFKGQSACEFGIQNSSEPYLLGDTFLRSAYVVYDLVNNQIALGQTNFNATSSNIVAFASSGAPIPSATAAPSQAQISQPSSFTEPAYAAQSGFASSATASSGSSSSGGGGSSKNAAGVNVVPIGLLHIGAITATMFIAGGLFIL
ncbi:hypothetical protein SPBR_01584 [Sporothrix brasiliensis 5110]|uniref:Peptidase A1 domain-containing protein n=1 Tax=Sporothrix brasiliensis 5110 TaxID=1398154 RepID=A0A0C2J451_9PEZI|nr:uncharacterized protein SPBR_01584 [Sporothrix brasiliensis 5110]KIH91867.1 hypothetical protein SPBR_01584 [Sporothrix brasiliensis 5110]